MKIYIANFELCKLNVHRSFRHQISVKNRNFSQKWNFQLKIQSPIKKFQSEIQIVVKKSIFQKKISVENRNLQNIQISVQNLNNFT